MDEPDKVFDFIGTLEFPNSVEVFVWLLWLSSKE